MTDESVLFEVNCDACTWHALWDDRQIERTLQGVGMLRRANSPDPALLHELIHGVRAKLNCPECGEPGIRVSLFEEGAWQEAVLCEVCRKPIPPQRLDAIPDAVRCVACQEELEGGAVNEEPEFCAKCGSPLVLKVSNSQGITRYRLLCTASPPCRS